MWKTGRFRFLIPLMAAVVMVACQRAEQREPAAASTDPQSSSAQPLGKPAAPVEISYRLLSEPRLGQPLEIEITANGLRSDQTVALSLNPDSGLGLASEANLAPLPLPFDEQRLERVVVTPLAEGRLFLNVLATVTLNGQQMFKAVSIPIQVGAVLDQPIQPRRDAAGTPIRPMPAEETTEN